MKKVAIIGHGYVGQAVRQYFEEHYEVVVYDPPQKLEDKDAVNECDLAVICVPTPMGENGVCDTSIVKETLNWLDVDLVLIKSTVPPGTTNALSLMHGRRIVFSPEYIGEGKYHVPAGKGYPHPTDMRQHEFFIFGGEREDTAEVIPYFLKVSGPDARYLQTDATTAELVKYMENSWGATKVTFCNEFYAIAQALGVDYAELRELFLQDGRVERMHTAVFPDNRGFGGKCFPKDVNAIVQASVMAGYVPRLLDEVLASNKRFRGEAP